MAHNQKCNKSSAGERNILVFDLGGGTFDVSLLTIDNGVFEVLATNGDTHLGGEDFDQRVMEYYIKLYKKKTGKDLRKDNRAVQKLRREVEKAKRALSVQHQVKVEVESIMDGEDFSETLTRAKFEELNMDLFRGTLVSLSRIPPGDSQPPILIQIAEAGAKGAGGRRHEEGGHSRDRSCWWLHPNPQGPAVAQGGRKNWIETWHFITLQPGMLQFFNGKEPSRGINPDEAVAYGAAVQAGVISGEEETEIVLLDVNPLTMGIETVGGVMTKLIPRNTVIPTKKSQVRRNSELAQQCEQYSCMCHFSDLLHGSRQPADGYHPGVRGRAANDEGQPYVG